MGEVYKEAIERLRKEIKKQLPEIEKNGDWLWNHPETGFKETETQKYCLEVLRQHGFEAKTWEDVTGFTCTYDTGKPGPCVMIMGEMDSLICRTHPDSDPQTGAAHACGHSVQTASAMGAFFAVGGERSAGQFLRKGNACGRSGGRMCRDGMPVLEMTGQLQSLAPTMDLHRRM